MPQSVQKTDMEVLSDPERLEIIHKLDLVDTLPEEAFDRLTRLAARVLPAPVSLVSIVDDARQFFKSYVGLEEPWASSQQTPLSHSFCQYVVASAEPLVVENALEHPLVKDNLAIPDLGVVSYLGMPLTLKNGHTLGSLCVIDHDTRAWQAEDIETLQTLAQSVITEIELRHELLLTQKAVEARARLLEELRQSEAYLRSVLSSQNTFILRTDMVSNYTYVNDVTYEQFGWMYDTKADMIGQPSMPSIVPEDHHKMIDAIHQIIANPQRSVQVTLRKPIADGTQLWVLWDVIAITDANGAVVEIQCVGIDYTDHKRLEQQQFELELEKQKLNLVTTFIEDAAHEFRTPLAVIESNAYLMARSDDATRREQKQAMTQAQVARITKLVDSLTMIARLEATDDLLHEPVSLCEIADEAVTAASAKAKSSLDLRALLDPTYPRVQGNSLYLCEAIQQILDNAMRFEGDENTVVLTVRHTDTDALVEIRDTGPGIPPEYHEDVFAIFWRLDDAHQQPGFGLGLAIAKRIIEKHKGTITLSSEVGAGTTFRVALPRIT